MMFISKLSMKFSKKLKKLLMYSILLIILRNLELYDMIKQKLQKKGLLKKLVDNLISHRSKIYDSIKHNYMQVVQHKTEQTTLAGLLIADSILLTVYKATSQINGTYWLTQPSTISVQNKQIETLQKTSYPILSETILRQLDVRFQLNYLRMIIFILQNFKQFYKYSLQSLQQYATKRTMRITFASETCIILKKIAKYIDSNVMKAMSLEVYCHLLKSIKENNNEQFLRDEERIKIFFQLWIRGKNFQGKAFLHQILRTYIHRFINQSQSKVIQSILMNIYDEKKFEQTDIEPLQEVVFESATHQDFNVRFTKGLLINILSYIIYSKDNELLSKEKIVLWGINEDYQNHKYKNANNEKTKINALIFVHKLAQKQIIDLNQTVTYNRYYFIAAYTFNLFTFRKNRQICSQISQQFRNIINLLNLKSSNIILETLFQQLKLEKDPQYQEHIIEFIYNLIDVNNLIEIREPDYQFFPKVSIDYKDTINHCIVDIGTSIIEYLSKRKTTQVIQKLCGFLIANFEILIEKQDKIPSKLQLSKRMQKCIKAIDQKGFKSFLQTYLQCLIQNFQHPFQNNIRDFFAYLHIEQTKQILTKKQLPIYFVNIMKQIDQKNSNQNIENKFEQIISKFMIQHPLQLNFKKQKQSEEGNLYKQLFSRHFAKNVIEQHRMSSEILTEPHFAERQDSIVRRSSSQISMDQSLESGFNQIIEVIKR